MKIEYQRVATETYQLDGFSHDIILHIYAWRETGEVTCMYLAMNKRYTLQDSPYPQALLQSCCIPTQYQNVLVAAQVNCQSDDSLGNDIK